MTSPFYSVWPRGCPFRLWGLGIALSVLAGLSCLAVMPVAEDASPPKTESPGGVPAAKSLPEGAAAPRQQVLPKTTPAGTPMRQESDASTPESLNGINPVLSGSASLVGSSNLLNPPRQHDPQERTAAFQLQLEAARQLRRENSTALAQEKLAAMLESPEAPEEIKRVALLELALTAQLTSQPLKAQQIYAQYLQTYPDDPSTPEILLRQGLLYRDAGAYESAINKFYLVLSSSLKVKFERLDYYERLGLQAQTEIAETYFMQGKHVEAAYNFGRLLKLENPELNRAQVQFKLIQSLAALENSAEVAAEAQDFLRRNPARTEEPEVRYLLATALKRLGRNQEAMQEVMRLLEAEQQRSAGKPEHWIYWQQRTGNDIANQLYKEGDYQSALQIYEELARLDGSVLWQAPVLYQAGLVFERLKQPAKARDTYDQIIAREGELGTNAPTPALRVLFDMAKWRKGFLSWQTNAELACQELVMSAGLTNHAGVFR